MRLPEYQGLRWIASRWDAAQEHDEQLRTLHFPPDLERDYLNEYFDRSIGPARVGATAILGFYLLFGLTEIALPSPVRSVLWALRYGIVCPYILAGIIFSYSYSFRRWMKPVVISGLLLLGLASISHFLIEKGSGPFLDLNILISLMTITTGGYTLARLRVTDASLVGWSLMLAYMVVMAATSGEWHSRFIGNFLALLLINLLGMAAAHSVERYLRRDFLLTRAVQIERDRSERLLLNILPAPIVERLERKSGIIADSFDEATVLFADIQDFTPRAARMDPAQLVTLLNEVFTLFDDLTEKHQLEKIKTSGDAYMVAGGIPKPHEDHAGAVADLALDMSRSIRGIKGEDGVPLGLRIGIHTGPVVAGVIGTRKFAYDLWGDTVNIASRMETLCMPGTIQVSQATFERLEGRYRLEQLGDVPVKGRGTMSAYLLVDRCDAYEATTPTFTRP